MTIETSRERLKQFAICILNSNFDDRAANPEFGGLVVALLEQVYLPVAQRSEEQAWTVLAEDLLRALGEDVPPKQEDIESEAENNNQPDRWWMDR